MRKLLALLIIFLATSLVAIPVQPAAAQSRGGDLSGALDRLQGNPRYQGQIIGTQIRRTERGALYEVQILRRDDRVIVVYIDPATGGVVGDSESRGGGNGNSGRGRGNR
ncbi:MAG: hypothetical protein GKS02_00020 [Alphaproteobacteria bacterium]|nr:hypothetical protein [Alphaproteobacteria bacterium]